MTFEDIGIRITGDIKPGYNYTTCPNCSEDRKKKNVKCLTVHVEANNNWWNCNHCGYSGNLESHAKYDGVRKEAGMPKQIPEIYSPIVTEFFNRKGLSVATVRAEYIYEKSSGVLGFPYYNGHNLVNCKFRDLNKEKETGKKVVYQISREHNSESCFWGLHKLDFKGISKGERIVIITEGETDRLTWLECGYTNILSVPEGAPSLNSTNFEKKYQFVTDRRFRDIADTVDWFYLATDGDEAGLKCATDLAGILGKDKCKIGKYPNGYKDVNEIFCGDKGKILLKRGKEGVETFFKSFTPYPMLGIIRLYDVDRDIEQRRKEGVKRGLLCGMPNLDKHVSFFKGHLWIITGIAKMGKSTLLRDYLMKLVKKNKSEGLTFGLFTPEMSPPAREYSCLIQCYAEKRLQGDSRYNGAYIMDNEKYFEAKAFVNDRFIICNPDTLRGDKNEITKGKNPKGLDAILSYMLYLKRAFDIDGFVIDAWNKIEHDYGRDSETNYISKSLDRIQLFCQVHDITCFLVAHPTKINKVGGKFNNPNFEVPSLYSISGSSNWFNKTTVGFVVHRNKYIMTGKKDSEERYEWLLNKDAPTVIDFQAIKFDEIGEEGETRVKMDWKLGDTFVPYTESLKIQKPEVRLPYADNDKEEPELEAVQGNMFDDKEQDPF